MKILIFVACMCALVIKVRCAYLDLHKHPSVNEISKYGKKLNSEIQIQPVPQFSSKNITRSSEGVKKCMFKQAFRKLEILMKQLIDKSNIKISSIIEAPVPPQDLQYNNFDKPPTSQNVLDNPYATNNIPKEAHHQHQTQILHKRKVRQTFNRQQAEVWSNCVLKSEMEEHKLLENEHILSIKQELEKLKGLVRLLRDQQYILNILSEYDNQPESKKEDAEDQKQLVELLKLLKNTLPGTKTTLPDDSAHHSNLIDVDGPEMKTVNAHPAQIPHTDKPNLSTSTESNENLEKLSQEINHLKHIIDTSGLQKNNEVKFELELEHQKKELDDLHNEINRLRSAQVSPIHLIHPAEKPKETPPNPKMRLSETESQVQIMQRELKNLENKLSELVPQSANFPIVSSNNEEENQLNVLGSVLSDPQFPMPQNFTVFGQQSETNLESWQPSPFARQATNEDADDLSNLLHLLNESDPKSKVKHVEEAKSEIQQLQRELDGLMGSNNNKKPTAPNPKVRADNDEFFENIQKLIETSDPNAELKEVPFDFNVNSNANANLENRIQDLQKQLTISAKIGNLEKKIKKLQDAAAETKTTDDDDEDIKSELKKMQRQLKKLNKSKPQSKDLAEEEDLLVELKSLQTAINSLKPKEDDLSIDGGQAKDGVSEFQIMLNKILNKQVGVGVVPGVQVIPSVSRPTGHHLTPAQAQYLRRLMQTKYGGKSQNYGVAPSYGQHGNDGGPYGYNYGQYESGNPQYGGNNYGQYEGGGGQYGYGPGNGQYSSAGGLYGPAPYGTGEAYAAAGANSPYSSGGSQYGYEAAPYGYGDKSYGSGSSHYGNGAATSNYNSGSYSSGKYGPAGGYSGYGSSPGKYKLLDALYGGMYGPSSNSYGNSNGQYPSPNEPYGYSNKQYGQYGPAGGPYGLYNPGIGPYGPDNGQYGSSSGSYGHSGGPTSGKYGAGIIPYGPGNFYGITGGQYGSGSGQYGSGSGQYGSSNGQYGSGSGQYGSGSGQYGSENAQYGSGSGSYGSGSSETGSYGSSSGQYGSRGGLRGGPYGSSRFPVGQYKPRGGAYDGKYGSGGAQYGPGGGQYGSGGAQYGPGGGQYKPSGKPYASPSKQYGPAGGQYGSESSISGGEFEKYGTQEGSGSGQYSGGSKSYSTGNGGKQYNSESSQYALQPYSVPVPPYNVAKRPYSNLKDSYGKPAVAYVAPNQYSSQNLAPPQSPYNQPKKYPQPNPYIKGNANPYINVHRMFENLAHGYEGEPTSDFFPGHQGPKYQSTGAGNYKPPTNVNGPVAAQSYSNPQQNSVPSDPYAYQRVGELKTQIYGLQNVISNLNRPEYAQKPEDQETIYKLDQQISNLKSVVNHLSEESPSYNSKENSNYNNGNPGGYSSASASVPSANYQQSGYQASRMEPDDPYEFPDEADLISSSDSYDSNDNQNKGASNSPDYKQTRSRRIRRSSNSHKIQIREAVHRFIRNVKTAINNYSQNTLNSIKKQSKNGPPSGKSSGGKKALPKIRQRRQAPTSQNETANSTDTMQSFFNELNNVWGIITHFSQSVSNTYRKEGAPRNHEDISSKPTEATYTSAPDTQIQIHEERSLNNEENQQATSKRSKREISNSEKTIKTADLLNHVGDLITAVNYVSQDLTGENSNSLTEMVEFFSPHFSVDLKSEQRNQNPSSNFNDTIRKNETVTGARQTRQTFDLNQDQSVGNIIIGLFKQLKNLVDIVDDLAVSVLESNCTHPHIHNENCTDILDDTSNVNELKELPEEDNSIPTGERRKRQVEESEENEDMEGAWTKMVSFLTDLTEEAAKKEAEEEDADAEEGKSRQSNNHIQRNLLPKEPGFEDNRQKLQHRLQDLKNQLDSKLHPNLNHQSPLFNQKSALPHQTTQQKSASSQPDSRSSYYQPPAYYQQGYYQQPSYYPQVSYYNVPSYDYGEDKKVKKFKIKKKKSKKDDVLDKIFQKILDKILDKVVDSIPKITKKLLGFGLDNFLIEGDDYGYEQNGYGQTGYGQNDYGVQKDSKKFGLFSFIPMLILKLVAHLTSFVNKLKRNKFIKTFLVPGFVTVSTAGLVVFLVWWLTGDDEYGYGNYGQPSYGYSSGGYGYRSNINYDDENNYPGNKANDIYYDNDYYRNSNPRSVYSDNYKHNGFSRTFDNNIDFNGNHENNFRAVARNDHHYNHGFSNNPQHPFDRAPINYNY